VCCNRSGRDARNFKEIITKLTGGIMRKMFGIVCTVAVLMLLSGCGEQLASEAQKAADLIAKEASKTASKTIDEFKNDTLKQLKEMRGEGDKGEADEKTGGKPDETTDGKTASKPD
jgi:hypothetical protein